MNIDSILLLMGQEQWLLDGLKLRGITAMATLPQTNLISRLIRKIWIKYNIYKPDIWFGNWKYIVKNYTTIILFANKLTEPVLYWLQNKYPEKRIIFWYWNPVSNCINPKEIVLGKNTELWTFDANDSKNYGMRYNTSFYWEDKTIITSREIGEPNDVFFIGLDKGRYEYLYNLKKQFANYDVNLDIYVVKERNKKSGDRIYSSPMSYPAVLQKVKGSKAVLEIMQLGQCGVTLRTFESLFYHKKLITDNSSIKREPFYSPDNIFVLGIDDIASLREFIDKKWDDSVDKWIEYYSPYNWIKRFS